MGVFIGIDPGKKGGVAVIRDGQLVYTEPMGTIWDIRDTLVNFKRQEDGDGFLVNDTWAYIEKSQARPGQGVVSMFNYGKGFGEILGILTAIETPYELTRPQQWQKVMIPGSKKGNSKKDALIKARQLFPQETFIQKGCRKPHDGIIDAVLIAEYGRRQHVAN